MFSRSEAAALRFGGVPETREPLTILRPENI